MSTSEHAACVGFRSWTNDRHPILGLFLIAAVVHRWPGDRRLAACRRRSLLPCRLPLNLQLDLKRPYSQIPPLQVLWRTRKIDTHISPCLTRRCACAMAYELVFFLREQRAEKGRTGRGRHRIDDPLAHAECACSPRVLGEAQMKTPNREQLGVLDWWSTLDACPLSWADEASTNPPLHRLSPSCLVMRRSFGRRITGLREPWFIVWFIDGTIENK